MSQEPNPSWRKPVGMLLILALIAGWSVAAVTLVEAIPMLDSLVFYVVAGVAWIWILPLKRLLVWMELGRWR